MKKNFIVFGKPFIDTNGIQSVMKTLKSGWIGTGKKVKKFEKLFSDYKSGTPSVAVNSCTAALYLSLKNLQLKKNDEVITTPLTFASTVSSIMHAGATPILVDVCKNTANIDPEKILQKITKKTKALLVVHLYGRPCEMDKIVDICRQKKIKLIEDCAHAIEAKYKNQHCGTFGDYGCFSFYPNKNITTGEGGMVVSKSQRNLEKIKISSLHGLSKNAWKRFHQPYYEHYDVIEVGYKYNMTDIQAAIGISQLKNIERMLKRRNFIWKIYNENFLKFGIVPEFNLNDENIKHGRHLYTIMVNKIKINRDLFLSMLSENSIGTGVHYRNITDLSVFKKILNFKRKDLQNSLLISNNTISLPLYPSLKDIEIEKIISVVKKIVK